MGQQAQSFESYNKAEETIKEQVLSLCDSYSKSMKQILPVLKRSSLEPKVSHTDQGIFSALYTEGNDHLHNLVQLSIELSTTENNDRGMILEISAEVLANTIKYLNDIPQNIQKTTLHSF
jgi:hypothetical protein